MTPCTPEIIQESQGVIRIIPADSFNLYNTVTSGQLFNYYNLGEKVYGLVYGNEYAICGQSSDGSLLLNCKGDKTELWCEYLDLYVDYDKSIQSMELDFFAKEAYEHSKGTHIIKQDPFETSISYIISQNNRIENISKIVKNICRYRGDLIGTISYHQEPDIHIYSFPSKDVCGSMDIDMWKRFSVGFRAIYIYHFVDYVVKNKEEYDVFGNLTTEDLIDVLQSFAGIGPKVANCISLFGYHRIESFPVDLWIERIINQKYDGRNPALAYGDMAGIMQQYMFNYVRNGNGLL